MTADPKTNLDSNPTSQVAYKPKPGTLFGTLFRCWYWFFQLLALGSFMAGSFILGITLVPLLG